MGEKGERLMEKLEENHEIIEKIIDRIVILEKTGALKTLEDLAAFVKVAEDTLSDEIVKKNAELITNLSLISAKFTSERSLVLLDSIGDAICRCEREPEPVGLAGLIRALSDPDVKLAMGFLVNLAKSLGQALRERA